MNRFRQQLTTTLLALLLTATPTLALAHTMGLGDDPVFDEPVTLVTRNQLSLAETLELLGLSIGYTVFTKGLPEGTNNAYDFETPRTFRDTLDIITRLYNLDVVTSDNLIIVAPTGELTTFEDTPSEETREERTEVTYTPENIDEILALINQAQPNLDIIHVAAARALLITGTKAQHDRVQALITEFDERISNNREAPVETITRLYDLTAPAATVRELITQTYPDITTALLNDLNSLSITMPVNDEQKITDFIATIEKRQAALAPTRATYRINNSNAGQLATSITEALSLQGHTILAMPDERTNQLTVVATNEVHELVKTMIQELDEREQQVRVRVRIHEVSTSEAERLGINIAAGVGTLTTNILDTGLSLVFNPSRVINALTLNATLDTLAEQSLARSIDDANILMLNNTTSQINSGGSIELVLDGGEGGGATQSLQFGTNLTVTPQISSDGFITLSIIAALSGFDGEMGALRGVRFTEQALRTTVQVRDGDIVVLGGLIQEGLSVTESGVPILKDIPIIGTFFRTTNSRIEESELIVTLEVNLEDSNDITELATTDD